MAFNNLSHKRIDPESPLLTSGPTNNVHLTALECNWQSGLQCKVLPWVTERVSFTSLENPKVPKPPLTSKASSLRSAQHKQR
jgi:hypothetical protein